MSKAERQAEEKVLLEELKIVKDILKKNNWWKF